MPTFDVFLSHNGDDKPAVEELARRLQREGLRPFLDHWHLIPGDPWQEALEKALGNSATCVVFLGPRGLGPWQREEMRVAIENRVKTRGFRLIPVLLPGAPAAETAELPPFLRQTTWVRFREDLDDTEAFHRLLSGVRGHPPGGTDGTLQILPTLAVDFESLPNTSDCQVDLNKKSQSLLPAVQVSGTSRLGEPFYIPWLEEEGYARQLLEENRAALIFAPRYSGKTYFYRNLLSSITDRYHLIELSSRTIPGDVKGSDALFKWIGTLIVQGINGDPGWVSRAWNSHEHDTMRFEHLLRELILPACEKPVLLAMDDADLIFRHLPKTQLFNVLRSYKDKKVPPWDRFCVLATVRHTLRQLKNTFGKGSFFINSVMINLPSFDSTQLHSLAAYYGVTVEAPDLQKLLDLLGGHPYLSDRLLSKTAQAGLSVLSSLEASHEILRADLQRSAQELSSQAADAFEQLLIEDGVRLSEEISDQLYILGIVRQKLRKTYLRCSIYRHLEKWLR